MESVSTSETNTEPLPESYVNDMRKRAKEAKMQRALVGNSRMSASFLRGRKKTGGLQAREVEHPEHGPIRVVLIPKRAVATPKNDQARISAAQAKRDRKAAKRLDDTHQRGLMNGSYVWVDEWVPNNGS